MSTAKQVKMRRGTTLENDLFTGAEGEVTVDTTIGALRVHDGLKIGGYELALSDLTNVKEDSSLEQRILEAVQELIAAAAIGGGGGSTGEVEMIGAVSGRFVDPGEDYILANGELLNIADHPDLYSSIGRKFGTESAYQIQGTGGVQGHVGVQSNYLTGLAINGNTIVGSYMGGMVATSIDNGNTWIQVDTGAVTNLQGVVFANGMFVTAGTNRIAYSPDGLVWTVISNITATFTKVITLNNRFFLWAATTCYTSTDGVTWSPYTMTGFTSTAPLSWFYSTVFNRYYAGGSSGTLSSSVDGTAWATQTSNMTNSIYDMAQNTTTLVLVGGNASTVANIATSTNGTTFVASTNTIASFRTSVVWFPAANKFFTVGQNAIGYHSPDGVTWTATTLPNGGFAWNAPGNLVVTADGTTVAAMATNGTMVTSTDLLTWTSRSSTFASRTGSLRLMSGTAGINWAWGIGGIHRSSDNFESAYWVIGTNATTVTAQMYYGWRSYASDGSGNYAVAMSSGTMNSTGDVSGPWSMNTLQSNSMMGHWFYDKAANTTTPIITGVGYQPLPEQMLYMNGIYIAWGNFGGLATSTDGKVWTASRVFPASGHVTKVIYASGKYIAVGTNGKMFYSTNGTTWTACTHTYGTNNIYDVHWVPQQNKFYACGDLAGHVMSSTNGITWIDVDLGTTNIQAFYCILHTKKRLAFFGGNASGTVGNQVASMNHNSPSTLVVGTTPTRFELIDGGEQWFVTGGTTTTGGYPLVYYSADGIGWASTVLTSITGLATGNIIDVNWMGDGYFAIGTGATTSTPTFWSSPNGINWTQKFSSSTNMTPQKILSPQGDVFPVVTSTSTGAGAMFNSTPEGKFRLPNIVPKNPYDPDPYIMLKKA